MDKPLVSVENTVDTEGITRTFSTEEQSFVDNSVDNLTEAVEKTTEFVENTVDRSEEDTEADINSPYDMDLVLKQAEDYYFYYFTLVKQYDEDASIFYSENKFLKSWNELLENTLEDYYLETGWVDRGGYYSLMFVPKNCMFIARQTDVYDWLAMSIHGFMLAKEKYSSDELWDNELSLIPQYHCHVLYAGAGKTPWNIEPHRTETSFINICAAKGNPE